MLDMNSKQRLSHALMMRFGLSGSEPSFIQLDRIKNDLAEIIEKGLLPDDLTGISWLKNIVLQLILVVIMGLITRT